MTASQRARHVCVKVQMMIACQSVKAVSRLMYNASALVALLVIASVPAAADPRYAAMTVDANTGKVLLAEAADEARYPASLTKIMTLYIVFEQMQLGRLRADSQIRISEEAASVPPSKLGLKPGSTIAVSDAIKALITKSANDIAVALAEHIAGSEDRFAQLMTRKAQDLGMRTTTFRNASGLPDQAQVTTARDMLTLGLRLYDAFPREARAFSLRSFQYAGRKHRNHNTMLDSFEGMDGIKTGYTRASGFNLLASVHRDGRHVMAVVLGGKSASARNARMRVVLGRALQQASPERSRSRLVVAAQPVPRPAPASRPTPVQAPARIASRTKVEQAPAPRLAESMRPAARVSNERRASADSSESWGSSAVRLAAPVAAGSSVATRVGANNGWQPSIASDATPPRPPSTLQAQAMYLASASSPFADSRARQEQPTARRGSAEIQVGAFSDAGEARDRLDSVRQVLPQLLRGVDMAVPSITVGGRTFYRARFVGLDAITAASACADLRKHQIDCLVTRAQ